MAIKVIEGTTEDTETLLLSEARVHGWLVFVRRSRAEYWECVASDPVLPPGIPDSTCPWPLHKSRDGALDKAQQALKDGGEVMLFRVRQ